MNDSAHSHGTNLSLGVFKKFLVCFLDYLSTALVLKFLAKLYIKCAYISLQLLYLNLLYKTSQLHG